MRKLAANYRLTYTLCRPQSTCGFASVGPAEYTGGRIPNINFNSTYLTAEFARGSVGLEDVTIAGLTVRNQHMSLAEKVFLSTAYNMTSGIIGKSYLPFFAISQIV